LPCRVPAASGHPGTRSESAAAASQGNNDRKQPERGDVSWGYLIPKRRLILENSPDQVIFEQTVQRLAGVFGVEPLIEHILWVQTLSHRAYMSHRGKRPRKAIGHEKVTSQG
jgi:hypothetical protein